MAARLVLLDGAPALVVDAVRALVPPIAPGAILDLAAGLAGSYRSAGCGDPLVLLDVSSDASLAALLTSVVPSEGLIGLKVTSATSHDPMRHEVPIGTSIGSAMFKVWHAGRTPLLADIGVLGRARRLVLPAVEDEPEVAALRAELTELSVERRQSGKEVIVGGGHDDLAMALAYACWLTLHGRTFGAVVEPFDARRLLKPSKSWLAWI